MNVETVSRDLHISNHQAWLQHPVTHATQQIIQQRIDKLTDFIADRANDKNTTDAEIRQYAAQIRILKLTQKDLYVTETFINAIRPNAS